MKTPSILAAAVFFACTVVAAEPAAKLFLDRDGTPVIRYAMNGATSEGRFVDARPETHAEVRQKFWSYDPNCFELREQGVRRLAERCGAAEMRLSWDNQPRDRTYPLMVKLQNGGVLVATQYLQPLTNDARLVDWQVEAPAGGVVVFRGEKSTRSIMLGERQFAHDGRGYVYLGPDDFTETPGGRALVDRGVPAALSEEAARVTPRLLAELEKRLGAKLDHRPSIFLTWVDREGSRHHSQADVVPGAVIRVGLAGSWWGSGAPQSVASLRSLLAHEVVHFWNERFTPATWSSSWVSEGNAELLSLAALVATGETSAAEAAESVGSAINECNLLASGRSWVQLYHHEKHFGRGPYHCGLAFQFAAVAAAAKANPAVDAFEFWRRVWREHPVYFEAVVPGYFTRTGDSAMASDLAALLTEKSVGVEDGLRRLLTRSGLEFVAGAPSTGGLLGLRRRLMGALMQRDCQGNVSFFTRGDHYEIVDGAEILCKTFRKGMVFRWVEGVDIAADTAGAIAKANDGCRSGGKVRLRSPDGTEIEVPCPDAPFPDERGLVRLSPEAVKRVLAKPAG